MVFADFNVYLKLSAIILIALVVALLLMILIIYLIRKDKSRYNFLKNLVYGLFGGIIATIILQIKGNLLTNPGFFIGEII